jgi:thiamine transport system substrate-binding protein
LTLPVAWDDPLFLPFDWGYFAFVHDRSLQDVPGDFEALAASDISIVIQDPRSSTPGLGLLLWVEAAYGDRAGEIWAALADNIVTVTPGLVGGLWPVPRRRGGHGAFLYNIARLSPDRRGGSEQGRRPFAEGHYMQIEVAGILESSDQPELARAFLDFMLTEAFQSVIPTTNWMYPAALPAEALPDGFDTLITPDRALILSPEEAAATRDAAIATWQSALSR